MKSIDVILFSVVVFSFLLSGCVEENKDVQTSPKDLTEAINNDEFTTTPSPRTYKTVKIGDQTWMAENLDVGTMIQGDQMQTNNNIIEKYCYENDPANCSKYGGLYTWSEAMKYNKKNGAQGICPDSWHIPTRKEFNKLIKAVKNNNNALTSESELVYTWETIEGTKGTNTSGFSTLMSGISTFDGSFAFKGEYTEFRSSTEINSDQAYGLSIGIISSDISYPNAKEIGFSIRCIKD